jgi:hypothetical protein
VSKYYVTIAHLTIHRALESPLRPRVPVPAKESPPESGTV